VTVVQHLLWREKRGAERERWIEEEISEKRRVVRIVLEKRIKEEIERRSEERKLEWWEDGRRIEDNRREEKRKCLNNLY
jgi:hypothetical protein